MYHDFIRFGDAAPQKGLSLEEHLSRYYNDDVGKEALDRSWWESVKSIWKKHRPPTDVAGVYAFVNFPGCIDVDIIPTRYYKGIMTSRELSAILRSDRISDIKKYNAFDFTVHYNWSDISAVWAKFMPTLQEDRMVGIRDPIPWYRFGKRDRSRFEDIVIDRLFNRDKNKMVNERIPWNREIWFVGEVFLEM